MPARYGANVGANVDREAASRAFQFKLHTKYDKPGLLRTEQVVIKNGPQAYKSASLLVFGDKQTGELKRKELRVQTWKRTSPAGGGYDFTGTAATWYCEDEEITRLQAMLNQEFPETGLYQLADKQPTMTALLSAIEAGGVEPEAIRRIVAALVASPGVIDTLAGLDEAAVFASVVDRARQHIALSRLREVVDNPDSSESDIQRILQAEPWIFGGRYFGQVARRSLVIGDQLDIPLVRGDGTLHVVELKQANLPKLVVRHRNHLIVGPDVNEAVGQAINYLRSLDEHRANILADLGIDCRRASATVVVGHPRFVAGLSEPQVAETIRTYNSHLARVEVLTYKDLIDGVERSLALSDEPHRVRPRDASNAAQ